LYGNDRLALDLVIRENLQHLMACEFKAHVSAKAKPKRRDAWDILDDLSRLALANVMWRSVTSGCPSYFVHLSSDRLLRFLRKSTPRLATLLEAGVGESTRFDVLTEIETLVGRGEKTKRRRPPYELDLHSGSALCIARDCVEHDDHNSWLLSMYSICGDDYLALDY